MVNRLWQATGFCPPFAFLPDGSGLVIPPSKRRIAKTCKFLPKNTLFRSPAMVFLTLFDHLYHPPSSPQNPPRFENPVLPPLPTPQNPPPPFSAPGVLKCATL